MQYLRTEQKRKAALVDVATRLAAFLIRSVANEKQATAFWEAIPAVLSRCDYQDTYELPMAPEAYAWLHLLDRYIRTWWALETMFQRACFPLAAYGVNVLDVGTGPGPSTLAVTAFYSALSDYASVVREPRLMQLCNISAVELNNENNAFRLRFREVTEVPLSETTSYDDILRLDPHSDRSAFRDSLLHQSDYDPYSGQYEYVTSLTSDEERRVNQLHRYRLVTITNFLTNAEILHCVWDSLAAILSDLQPGSVVVLIGGSNGQYPEINEAFDKLASQVGLRRKITDARVVSSRQDTDIIIQTARTVARHVSGLAPIGDCVPTQVLKSLERGTKWGGTSRLSVYRRDKYRYKTA